MGEGDFGNFWLSWYRENFKEQLEGLKQVHTREALKKQKERLDTAKGDLLRYDQDFRDFMKIRKREAEFRAAEMRAEAEMARAQVMSKVSSYDMMPRSPVPALVPSLEKYEEVICCPECLRLDTGNKTNQLNRKQRRSKPYLKGYKVHESAYCVYCNSRMVYMLRKERMEKLAKREEERLSVNF